MFPLLLGLGAVATLVGLAIRGGGPKGRKIEEEKKKLARLKMRTVLNLDEAEDGKVLARKFGDHGAEVKFAIEVGKLRKKRPRV